jgi:hypothetical protein
MAIVVLRLPMSRGKHKHARSGASIVKQRPFNDRGSPTLAEIAGAHVGSSPFKEYLPHLAPLSSLSEGVRIAPPWGLLPLA